MPLVFSSLRFSYLLFLHCSHYPFYVDVRHKTNINKSDLRARIRISSWRGEAECRSPVQSFTMMIIIHLLMEGVVWHFSMFERMYWVIRESYTSTFARDKFHNPGQSVYDSLNTLFKVLGNTNCQVTTSEVFKHSKFHLLFGKCGMQCCTIRTGSNGMKLGWEYKLIADSV